MHFARHFLWVCRRSLDLDKRWRHPLSSARHVFLRFFFWSHVRFFWRPSKTACTDCLSVTSSCAFESVSTLFSLKYLEIIRRVYVGCTSRSRRHFRSVLSSRTSDCGLVKNLWYLLSVYLPNERWRRDSTKMSRQRSIQKDNIAGSLASFGFTTCSSDFNFRARVQLLVD